MSVTEEPTPSARWGLAPSLDDFVLMAQSALEALDQPFSDIVSGVAIKVEDVADEETLESLMIEDPYELTGLYSGVALSIEAHTTPSAHPPMIWLYRLPILDEWAARGDVKLEDLVAHVLIHELGHHFGWSDEEMDKALGEVFIPE